MAYNNNQNSGKRNNNYFEFPKINQSLHLEYNNPAELYLPDKKADIYAHQLKGITNHQMRKILNTVKLALQQADYDLSSSCKQMYLLVAMTAYNTGRMPKMKPLYNFLSNTINEQSVKTKEDIEAFDQMFTSIVAYHKFITK